MILLTAKGKKEDVIKGLEAGADDYLVKPFDREELKWRIRIGGRILALERKIKVLASTDSLTGVLNRRAFMERMDLEAHRAVRQKSGFSLLMADIDHFKQVNDTRGHLVGDRVLMEIGALIQTQIRSEDVLARFGGEEFAVLVREIPPPGVMVLAERIRAAVEEMRVKCTGGDVTVTVSIGVQTVRGGSTLVEQGLIDAADRLLYRAKATGRNRTCAESAT